MNTQTQESIIAAIKSHPHYDVLTDWEVEVVYDPQYPSFWAVQLTDRDNSESISQFLYYPKHNELKRIEFTIFPPATMQLNSL